MITPTKKALREVFSRCQELAPDVRLGQLIHWVAFLVDDGGQGGMDHLEDDEFLQAARRHLAALEARDAGPRRDSSTSASPAVTEALAIVEEISAATPGVSFGRLMCVLDVLGQSLFGRRLFDLDDEQLVIVARQHRETLERGRAAVAPSLLADADPSKLSPLAPSGPPPAF